MKKLFKEFLEFINKGNAFALAIGVIIGSAFTAIVSAINLKIISPLIGEILGGYNLSESLVTVLSEHTEVVDGVEVTVIDNAIYWGAFLQSIIDFLLTAIILFVIFKVVTMIINHARKAAELIKERLDGDDEEEVKEEAPVVEEVPVVEEKPSPEVLLLTEIRDLLSKKTEE